MSGLRIAACYGITPHLLGFCGPKKKSTTRAILQYLSGDKIPERKLKKIFKEFEGAYSYYKLIARSNKIQDPFDEKVVKAYWIGNKLLDKVPTESLRKMVIKEFSRPGLLPKKLAEKKAKEIPAQSCPHHSFHVLVIGSVTGRVNLEGKLLDFCRVGWSKIIKLDSSRGRIKIKFQPLLIKKKYLLGKRKEKYIIWNKDLLPNPKIGSTVSFHWNQASQILTRREEKNLRKYTQNTLDTLNFKH